MFALEVETGAEILEVYVYDRDDIGKDDFEGSFSVGLQDFIDQDAHDEWFDLAPPKSGQQWRGKIRLLI